jgi:hypothetical protein
VECMCEVEVEARAGGDDALRLKFSLRVNVGECRHKDEIEQPSQKTESGHVVDHADRQLVGIGQWYDDRLDEFPVFGQDFSSIGTGRTAVVARSVGSCCSRGLSDAIQRAGR